MPGGDAGGRGRHVARAFTQRGDIFLGRGRGPTTWGWWPVRRPTTCSRGRAASCARPYPPHSLRPL